MDIPEYERRFRAAGLPLLIEDFRASEDVWTRALPLLAIVFTFEMFGALDLDWGLVPNLLAIVGGAALLLAGFGIVNRMQGRKFLSVPHRVTKSELVAFVVIPAIIPLVFGGQWRSAMVTAVSNLLLLGAIYVVVGFGVLSILAWSGNRLFSQLATSLQLLSRALPLVMVSSLVLFFTTELWQVFADLKIRVIVVVSMLLLGLGALFILVRIPREVDRMQARIASSAAPLSRRQRLNVGLVMFVAQALQIILVTVGIGLFFVMLGSVTVTPHVQEVWLGIPPPMKVLLHFEFLGVPINTTRQLLVVAGGLSALGGLYFSIAVLTDGTYREEFHTQLVDEMEDTFRLRAEYLRVLTGESASAPEVPTG